MPGILPMKVIKVGTSAQSRIAQACDRCRSKKIRCDGIRPCCSQCANVGFECKTSDKLSRRAFPRGYTESLEERVRALEAEVRELKELLDEKDEKIDMLSKIHSQSTQNIRLPSPRRPSIDKSPASQHDSATGSPHPKEDTFKVSQSPYLLEGINDNSYFSGTSSVKHFLDAFKQKVEESGRSTSHVNADTLLPSTKHNIPAVSQASDLWKVPPRLVSDQMVNIFFQEWAPLFPVLHRPTFLSIYEKYVASPESVTDKTTLAQLHLVFGLAALSSGPHDSPDLASFEAQWRAALDTLTSEQTIGALQCLVLAQLYCIQRGDYAKLLTYKGLAISLSSRLGLHQSQKRFALGTLTCETRKKVFWTLYTIDSFSAVLLGLPKQLKDDDVHCEYPVDADDEYVTERGFQPTLPGESTKLSSALALFRATRILSRVLEEVYPALPSYDLALQTLSALGDELDNWLNSLPPHLRLTFAQDKPSTATTSSRSPLLSLVYHYTRVLIHRPAVCCSALGSKSSSSMIAMAGSCKSIVQIIQLLNERGLSFSFCLNKEELLVLCGFGLLYQGLSLEPNSKVLKDNQKMVAAVIGILHRSKALCASEFRRVACLFLPMPSPTPPKSTPVVAKPVHPALSRHNSDGAMPAPQNLSSAAKKQLKAVAARFMTPTPKLSKQSSTDNRRATEPNIGLYRNHIHTQSVPNVTSNYNPANISRSEPARSPSNAFHIVSPATRPSAPPASQPKRAFPPQNLNLDYLSFSESSTPPLKATSHGPVKPEPSDWERLLGSLDNGQTNIFDNIYGGPPVDALEMSASLPANPTTAIPGSDPLAWSPDIWALAGGQDFSAVHGAQDLTASFPAHPQTESVLSFSSADEGLTGASSGGEEFAIPDWASACSSGVNEAYRGIVMPDLGQGDDALLGEGWDAVFAN